ncbi:MAG: hypothetical protein H6779_02850 [Candidatus Nomurabacteria bacterium]|nr:hypothetical protein [Candidatus Nomurabacteria bacterium]USN87328.1 MAG: hypothetical protein H6779_02850 [Candidatus Nomurabacteria bacterium]
MRYLIFIFTIFLPISFTYAQSNFSVNQQTNLSITLKDEYTKPFSKNTATVDDYSVPLNITGISWKIDGEAVPEANNQKTVDFTTKDIGQPTTIEVSAKTFEGIIFSAKRVIRPFYLDIVIEPQTKTPSFYQGRAIPTLESTINLTALINSSLSDSENYIYNWSLNDTVLAGGSLRGNYKVALKVPPGYQNVVTVTITNLAGELVAKRTIPLVYGDPKMLFYETNTLYGVKHIPIDRTLNLIGNSVSVQAEPYFVDINTYNRPDVLEWKIDGQRSPSAGNNPYEVTLARQGSSGVSNVSFRINSTTNFLQGAKGSFKVNF